MSQPPTPAPDSQGNPPPTQGNTDQSPPQDPERQAQLAELKGLVKTAVLEVITEREQAPPKQKGKVDVLKMLFGSGD